MVKKVDELFEDEGAREVAPTTVTKKGNTKWKPANILELKNKDPNYAYKWAKRDESNIQRYEEEGWEVVDSKTDSVKSIRANGIDNGAQTDTTIKSREFILIRTPNENAEARRNYYKSIGDEMITAIKTTAENAIHSDGGKVYGRMKIT